MSYLYGQCLQLLLQQYARRSKYQLVKTIRPSGLIVKSIPSSRFSGKPSWAIECLTSSVISILPVLISRAILVFKHRGQRHVCESGLISDKCGIEIHQQPLFA